MKSRIGLPKLIKIDINNYSLYKLEPSFSFTFKDGINAVLGVNGIGKTTFIELILYSIVGFPVKKNEVKKTGNVQQKKSNTSYFKDRFDVEADNNSASVKLEYKVGESSVIIERSLSKDIILSLSIDGKAVETDETSYNNFIVKKMGFTDFFSVQTIVRTFLVFDEQRLNVAWEVTTQDEILKILLLEEEKQIEIAELERKVSGLDTEGRHLSEDRRIARERIAIIKEERDKLLESIVIDNNEDDFREFEYEKLLTSKNEVGQDIERYEDYLETLSIKLKDLHTNLSRILGERNEANQRLETIDTEIGSLESQLYKSMYEVLPDYYLPMEKNLITKGKCLACGNQNEELKERFVKNKKEHFCIICEGEIEGYTDFDESVLNEINILNARRGPLLAKVSNKSEELTELKKEISLIDSEVKNVKNDIDKKNTILIEIETILSEGITDYEPKDTSDQILLNLDGQINELTHKITEVYKTRDEMKSQLENVQNEFVSRITLLNNKMSTFFNKYASTFLGVNCELTLKQQTIRFIPHVQFMPKIAGNERQSIYSVSESQRFFLDQAFRMAIIDFLQSEIKDFETFFITETPEGSLDLAYEEQVAKMFKVFAESNNNIIFTSNLNSSNFLNQVFKNEGDSNSRILNMLEKGEATKVQQGYYDRFSEILLKFDNK